MNMKKSKVFILYTGGTIGMVNDPYSGSLKPFNFEHLHQQVPELTHLGCEISAFSVEKPIDSSDMHPQNWVHIAQTIYTNYNQYDGFVVLHGTDTMSYTASALSFMLQGLKKPVILTGSQLPIGTVRTDGKENLITAIEIAALKNEKDEAVVQEVAIYFEYSLYRGNRTTKVSASEFEAFKSANYPELAVAGVQIKFNSTALYRSKLKQLVLNTQLSGQIALIKLFPGISFSIVEHVFNPNRVQGIIIETFGSGNTPTDSKLFKLIEHYIQGGGIVLNITQCSSGKVVQGKYATSSHFKNLGVLGGGELTSEAAVAKMMFVCGQNISRMKRIQLLEKELVGEL